MSQTSVMLTRGLRIAIVLTVLLGVVSLCCLVLYYGALLDIWHENGSPDFWVGEGVSSFEWKWLAVLYWPMFLFHVVFIGTGIGLIVRLRSSRTDVQGTVRTNA
jgi:hypothetical protein